MDGFDALKLENQLCFPLYAASREVVKRYTPYLSELDLTYTQYICMLVLWERGSINVKALGELLWLDSGTLTPVLKALEAKGYVERSRSKEDERVLIAAITERGRDLRGRALDIPAKIGCLIKLSDDEAVCLYKALYRLLDNLKKE